MFHKVLAAVDDSGIGKQAFEQALALTKMMNAQLMLIYVQAPFESAYPNQAFPFESTYPGASSEAFKIQMEAWETHQHRGAQLLQASVDAAIAAGVDAESIQPLGNPGQTICEFAKTWGADLIVIGRRGHTGLDELIVGSVSNYVVHHAPCSVLTVQGME
ncbi:MAG: universal stress protein [Oscillatoriales cyanobacterium C42_A2020_001]|nr:universal stress protein [Leptolyngbyaceae cyanobacterium C42_A2020_001]